VPRRLRRMERKPPEAVEAMVLEETAHVVAQYWSATGRPPSDAAAPNGDRPAERPAPPPARNGNGGGRHARRTLPGRGGRHARRR
jgi:hypothetical protein